MISRASFIIGIGLFIYVMGGSAYLLYMQNIDGVLINRPITFNTDQNNLVTDKNIYHRGDTISIYNSLCKNRNYSVKTTWRLINETVVTFPDQGTKIPKVECVTHRLFVIGVIPQSAVDGAHHLEATAAIQLSAIHTVYYDFKSVEFTVI